MSVEDHLKNMLVRRIKGSRKRMDQLEGLHPEGRQRLAQFLVQGLLTSLVSETENELRKLLAWKITCF